jgi:hypothetical protein
MTQTTNLSQHQRCTGISRQSGLPCKNWAVWGSARCKFHGGAALKGALHPNYKTGRYSRILPRRLQARYYEAMGDNKLLENRESLALLDARLEDVLKRVDTGEAGKLWSTLKQTYKDLRYAMRIQDAVATSEKLGQLDDMLGKGLADYAAWGEVYKVLELRRTMAESERKRLVEMNQMITAERAMLLVGAIVGAIKKHVLDKTVLYKVIMEIRRLVSIPGDDVNQPGVTKWISPDMVRNCEVNIVAIEADEKN